MWRAKNVSVGAKGSADCTVEKATLLLPLLLLPAAARLTPDATLALLTPRYTTERSMARVQLDKLPRSSSGRASVLARSPIQPNTITLAASLALCCFAHASLKQRILTWLSLFCY